VPTRAYQTRSSVTAECSKISVFNGPRNRCSMIREIAINDTPIGVAICDARPRVSDWAPATGVQRSTKQSTSTARMSLSPSSRPIKSSKTRPRQRRESSPFAVERNVHLRKQTVQRQIARSNRRIHRQIGAIGPSYLGFYVEHRVCKVDIVFPAGTDIEFDRRTVSHCRQRMILDPATLLHAGLSRRKGEQIQFRLCTFAQLFVNESHYYENTSSIFLFFFLLVFTRRTPDPD